MKVSVIIPVYNAEETITETIASIHSQHSHEIICINDGSKDNSSTVISNLNHPNVVLVNRENKGAAASRNEGISLAQGEYIMFCDADDKLGDNIIDNMIKEIETYNTDIVVGQVHHLIGEKVYPISTYKDLKAVHVTDLNSTPEVIQSIGPYGKLYKKSKLENIRFDEDITFCEEHTFNLKAWVNSNISVIDDLAYLYNIGIEDSIVASSYKNITKYLSDGAKVRSRSLEILKDLDQNVSDYYSYRMDKLIIFYLIRNNYLKVNNMKSLLDSAVLYLDVINNINTTSAKELKTLVLTISTVEGYDQFKQIAMKLEIPSDKKTYRQYQLNAQKLKLKMKLRNMKNKSKKISH
ncbi:glycosyltransferase family 2 protein [Mammaliicoccus stepanovicii]|uniref:Teichoic acid biosynthesis protein X n=1 Tax=Mammaliicoccus stepanovicii TaxID=643214 RepID=A0A239ZQG3_9STAP|nr:glycosyltransferase family 2 protein [Mammaliicoccus stepanovicii]PNZ73695.1 glycosyltransferase family 2 protein [Mammaliicoccus stepanovicii]GGI43432.1 teichoic acid biosynthesis protein [Mammaliicoccus stepanovicii]SNV73492.1 teichoic acid biosynthesis protein X [Mammaliicoccus stepanovicii]